MITGRLSKRAIKMIQEWREIHIRELMENWRLAEERRALYYIDPLE